MLYLETIREVIRDKHDLVIKTPASPDWLNRIFGGDDLQILRKCPCPVWMTKAGNTPYRRIVAAIDVDDAYPKKEIETRKNLNLDILRVANAVALSESAELHIVCVWRALGENIMKGAFSNLTEVEINQYVEQTKGQFKTNLNRQLEALKQVEQDALEFTKPQVHLIQGWASKEIPKVMVKLKADLLVMGTVARTGVPGLLVGNTAESILNQVDSSVLAIKPPGFTSPIEE